MRILKDAASVPQSHHEIADCARKLTDHEYRQLRDDIRKNGQNRPILAYQGKVLDGRHRLRACRELGIAPAVVEFEGDADAAKARAWANNAVRRKDGPGETLAYFKRMWPTAFTEPVPRGGNQSNRSRDLLTDDEIAVMCGVSPATVKRYRAVETKVRPVAPELADAVDEGVQNVRPVAEIAKAAVEDPDSVREAAREIAKPNGDLSSQKPKDAVRAVKRRKATAERRAKQRAGAEKAAAELPKGAYQVLLADPPWGHMASGDALAPDNETRRAFQYDPMTDAEIVEWAVEAGEAAADDSLCFLWCVASNLPFAIHVLARLGFQYQANVVWWKRQSVKADGTPYRLPFVQQWTRTQHEHLLIGKRGKPPTCAHVHDSPALPSVFDLLQGAHSEKPDALMDAIDAMLDDLGLTKRVEFFARKPRDGWDRRGNEA